MGYLKPKFIIYIGKHFQFNQCSDSKSTDSTSIPTWSKYNKSTIGNYFINTESNIPSKMEGVVNSFFRFKFDKFM